MNESLQTALRKLRLSGLTQSLDIRLQEAASHGLNHAEFLELILQDELAVRADRLMNRRVKAAAFREPKTLEDFDFTFNPSIKKKQIFDLASCRFVREAQSALLLGPPGTGKSHIAQGVGYQAIKAGFTVLYRSIFDVVRDFLHDEAFAGLFEIIMRRHEVRSTMMTSNRPLEDWGKLIGDVPSATAILDRFLQHAEVITITGKSYRLRNKSGKDGAAKEKNNPGKTKDKPCQGDGQ